MPPGGLCAAVAAGTDRYPRIDTGTITDVYLVQTLGCDASLHGHNPYAMTFPDIYGPQSHLYPPGLVVNQQVQCGYCYPRR